MWLRVGCASRAASSKSGESPGFHSRGIAKLAMAVLGTTMSA